ncbi:hypothetical protein [Streptococcus constellatus]|uniref:hypothetical protein n=1 Tax=Streptococcus constellatus TaxID=76860 RepID=UPI00123C0FDC|nr:hypothetical protein [Streptococcus constellatus]
MTKEIKVSAQALVNFADSQAFSGIRHMGESFETTQERADYLNNLHDFKLVEILEVIEENQEKDQLPDPETAEENQEEDKIPDPETAEENPKAKTGRKGKKATKTSVSEGDSEAVSDEKDGQEPKDDAETGE